MTGALLLLSVLAPVLLTPLALHRRGSVALVVAPLPALLCALLVPVGAALPLPWLLLGSGLELDAVGRIFLLGSATLWLAAALYAADSLVADPHRGRFGVFFLLAMAGNFALLLASDAAGFYLGFAGMGFAAYGLVAHRRSVGARRGGRIYLIWTVVGELLLFSALVLLASRLPSLDLVSMGASAPSAGIMLLLVLGFGIKVALPGLHRWMPVTYPAAPAAGAAVLSGAMVNAGLLGWMRFMPMGHSQAAGWGALLLTLGLLGAFYGVLFGLLQRRPRVVLAYSSISQMGLLSAALGLALLSPAAAPALLSMVALYALHHGLAKGALFLAEDAHRRSSASAWTLALLSIAALALAGAPLTSGALAKAAYKDALPDGWAGLGSVLSLSTLVTTLLMARFLVLAARGSVAIAPLGAAGIAGVLLPVACGFVFMVRLYHGPAPELASFWPLAAGMVLALLCYLWPPGFLSRLTGSVPPGDIPALVGRWLLRRPRWVLPGLFLQRPLRLPGGTAKRLGEAETRLRTWTAAGTLWVLLLLLLVLGLLPALSRGA